MVLSLDLDDVSPPKLAAGIRSFGPLWISTSSPFSREVALHNRTQYLSEPERQLLLHLCARARDSLAATRTGDAEHDTRAFAAAWSVRALLDKLDGAETRVMVERRL